MAGIISKKRTALNLKRKNASPYAYVGYACNNNCIFCSEADEYLEMLSEKTLMEIKKDLRVIRKKYDFVSIMGREPTLRQDIIEIISFARGLGFRQIGITTNGRLFSVPSFTRAILSAGVNQIGVSLAGATSRSHDAQTRVPGSFTQTINGVKNLLKYKKNTISLLVNLPMNAINYRELPRALKLLTGLGVSEINILNVSPLSKRSRSKKMILPMRKLGEFVFGVLKQNRLLGRKNLKILLVEFPPCSLPRAAWDYFFPCLEKNNHKVRIPLCSSCQYRGACDGILESYLDLYGSAEFSLN